MNRTILRSDEIGCPSCAAKIEKRLRSLPGVNAAKVFFASGKIVVDHGPGAPTQEQLRSALLKLGYGARVESR